MGRDGHLEETLRRIIAEALTTEVQDPRVGFVTVSEVRLNRDRTVAQVFYTVMGDDEERERSLTGLKRCRGFLRQLIGDRTRLRAVPELRFQYDESLDRSFRLEQILDEIGSSTSADRERQERREVGAAGAGPGEGPEKERQKDRAAEGDEDERP